jgi:sortase A
VSTLKSTGGFEYAVAEPDPDSAARPRNPEPEPPRPTPRGSAAQRPRRRNPPSAWLRIAAVSAMLSGALILGFAGYFYGLSSLSEQHDQSVLYKTLAGRLALATAPVGPTDEGAPVAILDIPALGLTHLVVVEGTSSDDLTHGPGHLRSSVLPGQGGASVVYGRVAGFGAPFAHLMRLNRGDRITVTTGQGVATYVVESFGTSARPAPDPTPDRLVLQTADGALVPRETVQVSADLLSAVQPGPGALPSLGPGEQPLAADPGAPVPLLLWSQALLLVSAGATIAANRWSRWATCLCTSPVVLALVWLVYQNLALLLPNLS